MDSDCVLEIYEKYNWNNGTNIYGNEWHWNENKLILMNLYGIDTFVYVLYRIYHFKVSYYYFILHLTIV